MEKLKKQVQALADEELTNSMIKFPLFVSTHEGYAVIKEEVEETSEELDHVKDSLSAIWFFVRNNDKNRSIYDAECLKEYAIKLASESIQVAAMCQKFINSFKEESNE